MIALPEVFTASVTALRRNKTRSMLTALGIIIGVAAVIAAFAVGAGANKSIDEQISSFGSNFIMVFPDRSSRSTMGSRSYLTDEDAEAIAREVSGIDAVAPMINLSATVQRRRQHRGLLLRAGLEHSLRARHKPERRAPGG